MRDLGVKFVESRKRALEALTQLSRLLFGCDGAEFSQFEAKMWKTID